MRNSQIVHLSPAQGWADPTVEIRVRAEFEYNREVLLSAQGLLLLGETVIARVDERPDPTGYRITGKGGSGFDTTSRELTLTASLGSRSLQALVEARDSRHDGDVHLTLRLEARILKTSAFTPPSVHVRLPVQGGGTALSGPAVGSDDGDNFKLLALWKRSELISVEWHEQVIPYQIPSSRWVQDFAPAFGLGRSLLFEYRIPAEGAQASALDWLVRAVEDVHEMERHMASGDWGDVVTKSREVAEVLRVRSDEIRELLEEGGVASDAAGHLTGSMRELFQYASKFVHSTDKKLGLRPRMHVSKEDAYLAMALASSTVYLLSEKHRRANGRRDA